MPNTGGLGKAQPANKEVQAIADKVKAAVLAKVNEQYSTYQAVSYATQVVAGTNYFIKVKVGVNRYIHIRVYQPLPHENSGPQFSNVQQGKTLSDPITHF